MNLGDLNEQQLLAVTDTLFENTVTVASAGSGKTTVLTNRIAFLINKCDVEPHEIMAVTFTKKAANEMIERVEKEVKSIEGLWIGTFHRICTKLLKKFSYCIHLSNKFTIIEPDETIKMLKTIFKELNIECTHEDVKAAATSISLFKSQIKDPKFVYNNADCDEHRNLARIYLQYVKRCRDKSMLDYDDLILYTVYLLGVEHVKNWVRDNIKYILVDEYQDINYAQYVLIKKLLNEESNLFVVGDPKQSIYGFRNSDPTYIENFDKMFPNPKIMYLDTNYRSTKTIVEASNSLIKNNKSRFKLNCTTDNPEGESISEYEARNVFEEAKYISRKIKELVSKGCNYSDIAILYRTNSQSAHIENQLINEQIPYIIYKGMTFFKRAEVKDMLSFLRFISNVYDEAAFERSLKSIKGIGAKTVKAIIDYSNTFQMNYYNGLIAYIEEKLKTTKKENASIKKLKHALNIYTELGNNQDELLPGDLIKMVYDLTEYQSILKKNFDTKSKEIQTTILDKIDNIHELINLSNKICQDNKNTSLADFLDEVSLLTQEDSNDKDQVKLMTIHSSKGLEFGNVFLCGVEDDILPSFLSKGSTEELEEERRLMYVGMTRAKYKLFLTYCKYRQKGDMSFKVDKSYFIDEIDPKYIQYDIEYDKDIAMENA